MDSEKIEALEKENARLLEKINLTKEAVRHAFGASPVASDNVLLVRVDHYNKLAAALNS